MADARDHRSRRRFVGEGLRLLGAAGLGAAAAGLAVGHGRRQEMVWQLDPDKCMACGNCQTHCVLDVSAVKAVNCFARCGFCDVCTGYFPTRDYRLETGAENQLCPTGAIRRTYLEEQHGTRFFEYTIDEPLCIGCGKCVLGCRLMNGSLYLQVRHDRCQNCNECAIAVACPTQAFRRVPADAPNLVPAICAEAERALAVLPGKSARPTSPAVQQRKDARG
jgi:electron transport complex protein RnfB